MYKSSLLKIWGPNHAKLREIYTKLISVFIYSLHRSLSSTMHFLLWYQGTWRQPQVPYFVGISISQSQFKCWIQTLMHQLAHEHFVLWYNDAVCQIMWILSRIQEYNVHKIQGTLKWAIPFDMASCYPMAHTALSYWYSCVLNANRSLLTPS